MRSLARGVACFAAGGPLLLGALYALTFRRLRRDCPEMFDRTAALAAILQALEEESAWDPQASSQ